MFGRNRSHKGRSGGLADPARTSLHRWQSAPYNSHPGSQYNRAAKPCSLLAKIQAGRWRVATCLCGQAAPGEGLPFDGD